MIQHREKKHKITRNGVGPYKPVQASAEHTHKGIPLNERIGMFSDGVFAIVITLLILEVKVPEGVTVEELRHSLAELTPLMIGHLVSFIVLGIYWIAHHNLFMYIKRHDRVLLWLNLLFLMWVSTMPFVASLIIRFGDDPISVVFYGGVLAAAGFSLEILWWYVSHNHRLIDPQLDAAHIATVHRRILLAPICYLLAIGCAFFSLMIAKLLFIVVIVLYILPTALDRHQHRHHGQAHAAD
jgi:uncharacterized membrane protein